MRGFGLWRFGNAHLTQLTQLYFFYFFVAFSFLDSIDRIADLNYVPTDDDILQARVRTLAVSEHLFNIDGVTYR